MALVAEGPGASSRDYFDLFQLAPQFDLDLDDLAARFRNLQRAFHPDRFAGQDAGEQRAAAQLSADINAGYRVLRDPVARAGFMLQRLGCDLKALERQPLDGAFLMQQMHLREMAQSIAEADTTAKSALVDEVAALMDGALADFRVALADDKLDAAGEAWVQLLYITKLNAEVAGSSEPE